MTALIEMAPRKRKENSQQHSACPSRSVGSEPVKLKEGDANRKGREQTKNFDCRPRHRYVRMHRIRGDAMVLVFTSGLLFRCGPCIIDGHFGYPNLS